MEEEDFRSGSGTAEEEDFRSGSGTAEEEDFRSGSGTADEKYLCAGLGGVSFAVPVSVIIKILPDLKVMTVPGAPEEICGISYYGGYVFPVVSFERNRPARLTLLCRNGAGCIAYSADRAAEIKILSEEEQSCAAPAGDAGILLLNAEGTA